MRKLCKLFVAVSILFTVIGCQNQKEEKSSKVSINNKLVAKYADNAPFDVVNIRDTEFINNERGERFAKCIGHKIEHPFPFVVMDKEGNIIPKKQKLMANDTFFIMGKKGNAFIPMVAYCNLIYGDIDVVCYTDSAGIKASHWE